MKRFVEVVNIADPADQCDASNTYPEDLFDPYLPDQAPSPSSAAKRAPGPLDDTDARTECRGAVTVSPPGYCGEQGEVALVIFEVSQAVPHAILRAPYKAAVLLWRENGEWVPRSVRAFGSADWTHE